MSALVEIKDLSLEDERFDFFFFFFSLIEIVML